MDKGSTEEFVFDVNSQSTEQDDINNDINNNDIKDVIDCCYYSSEFIFLTKDNKIICKHIHNHTLRKISNNRSLLNIITFNGYLYGLEGKLLYVLCNDYYNSCYWVWKKVNWAPTNITHLSVTLNNQHLSIQTKNHNYIYNTHDTVPKIFNTNSNKRVYGNNLQCFIEFNNWSHKCYIYINDKLIETLTNVISGVLDHHNKYYIIHKGNPYKDVKLLSHQPYYIKH